ncbi:hypothetical protein [Fluviicola taffensis]|uniref:YD repeat-containing protein n=1 Tax=Fluviicola taffensis (strain DSM 16823 / NCIMB 13979 / RW262) TaxID=755732 RepID=F2IEX6_FLUTR|nr:hypothetical protein [Fluviicola taffensis]AEA42441.1 hypothetical protein Fluta_0435 [Fluviicola taffensis DSM 16823]
MKVFILVFSCLLAHWSFGQDYLTNFSPSTSYLVCGRTQTGRGAFDSAQGFLCVNGKSKLYYEYTPIDSLQLGTDALITFQGFTNSGMSTAINTSYRLFGPFEQTQNYSYLIETNSVIPISTGSNTTSSHSLSDFFVGNKKYVLEITANACVGYINFENSNYLQQCLKEIPCDNCLPKFQPVDDRYIISAWVKEATGSTTGALNYTNSQLKVTSGSNVYTFYPSGQIIDGWQRIEGIIQTNSAGNLKMELIVSSGTSYFDDIRVFPYDGSMMTYVYDPVTLRLMAELDERNYAKIYEYDEEGKLVRVKKETEKGIMTIQENRENSSTND